MNTCLFLVHNQSQDTAFVFLLRLEFLRFLPAFYIPDTTNVSFQNKLKTKVIKHHCSVTFVSLGWKSGDNMCCFSKSFWNLSCARGTSKNLYHTNCMHNYNILRTLEKFKYAMKLRTYTCTISNTLLQCVHIHYDYIYTIIMHFQCTPVIL